MKRKVINPQKWQDQPGEQDSKGMVRIPAGKFWMGTNRSDLEQAGIKWEDRLERETPLHQVYLPGYAIGKYPVTNAEFAGFIEGDGYTNPGYWTAAGWKRKEKDGWTQPRYWEDEKWNAPSQPVVGVSWYEAVAYCNWLTAKTGQDYRLPTEAEWEKAAKGADGRIYPWGSEWDPTRCNNKETGPGRPTPVGQYPGGDSPYGVGDMVGQVFEWCSSKYGGIGPNPKFGYPYTPDDGRENLEGTDTRVQRGGGYGSNSEGCRCGCRDWCGPWDCFFTVGFRCVLAPGVNAAVVGEAASASVDSERSLKDGPDLRRPADQAGEDEEQTRMSNHLEGPRLFDIMSSDELGKALRAALPEDVSWKWHMAGTLDAGTAGIIVMDPAYYKPGGSLAVGVVLEWPHDRTEVWLRVIERPGDRFCRVAAAVLCRAWTDLLDSAAIQQEEVDSIAVDTATVMVADLERLNANWRAGGSKSECSLGYFEDEASRIEAKEKAARVLMDRGYPLRRKQWSRGSVGFSFEQPLTDDEIDRANRAIREAGFDEKVRVITPHSLNEIMGQLRTGFLAKLSDGESEFLYAFPSGWGDGGYWWNSLIQDQDLLGYICDFIPEEA